MPIVVVIPAPQFQEEVMPDMDRYSNAANRIPQGAFCGDASVPPPSQENVAQHFDVAHKICNTIQENLAIISNGVGCSVPRNAAMADKAAQPPSMMTQARILNTRLSDMLEESNRIRQALGL